MRDPNAVSDASDEATSAARPSAAGEAPGAPHLPPIVTRRAAAVIVAFAALSVTASLLVLQQGGTPSGPPVGTPGTGMPGWSHPASSPGAQTADGFQTEGWKPVVAAPIPVVARLSPTTSLRLGIATTTRFTLTSLTSTPAAALAKGIEAEPALAFRVTRTADPRVVTLVPAKELEADKQYRLTLRIDDALAGSWVFRTAQPPRIVETLPRNEATGVPRDTGIEVTFDQDGVATIEPFFSISPRVAGRFEQHGRTWVFVPTKPLAAGTIYEVTVRQGVALAGSDQTLREDRTFAFETIPPAVASSPRPPTPAWLPRPAQDVLEAVPDEPPIVAFNRIPLGERSTGVTLQVIVHRFPTFEAALAAYASTREAPYWAEWSARSLVPTGDLPVVATFNAGLQESDGIPGSWIRFPAPLERGWYLVVVRRDGHDRQVHLQVSDLATYASVTTTNTLAWVNDVTTGRPVEGAGVRFAGMALLGRTDADGLVTGRTPTVVRTGGTGTLLVRAPDAGSPERPGGAVYVPLGLGSARPYTEYSLWGYGEDDALIHPLYIDRHAYRRTDTVDAWGLVRDRATGRSPVSVQLVLTTGSSEEDVPAISRTTVRTDPSTGAFKASIPLKDLPTGGYDLGLVIGGKVVESSWFEVKEIVKPSYRIAVEADRHVLIDGDRLTVTARATFFEDTPAAGVPLSLSSFDRSLETTTDAAGVAVMRTSARFGDDAWRGSYRWDEAWASPQGYAAYEVPVRRDEVILFPSSVWLRASGRVVGDRLEVSAATTLVDPVALERARDAGTWDGELKARPVAGTPVRIEVTEVRTVRVPAGTVYDFITKRAIPTYHYDTKERALGTFRVRTGPDGTVTVPVTVGLESDVRYRIHVVAADAAGRAMEETFGVERPNETPTPGPTASNGLVWPHLGDDGCGPTGYHGWYDIGYEQVYGYGDNPYGEDVGYGGYRTGEAVSVPFRDRDGRLMPEGGTNRYLFILAQRGLREARVQASPVFADSFRTSWAPNISLAGVRFTGRTYVPAVAPYDLVYDASESELTVRVAMDAARYRPGDRATATVTTTDEAGRPVDATVFVRALDERLIAMDAVSDADPLPDLYRSLSSGWLDAYASHQLPVATAGGCYGGQGGDTTGGGGPPAWRDDFRDSLVFAKLQTGADGRASVAFGLSDDLTSWHVSAAAVTGALQAGRGATTFGVGLPFFIEAPVPAELVLGDAPTLRVRTFGTALTKSSKVTFTVSAPDLGVAARTVRAVGYGSADVPLPVLPAGDHELRIAATMTVGGRSYQDALVRRVRVVATHLTADRTVVADLRAGLPLVPSTSDSMTSYLFTDGGRASYVATLYRLAYSGGSRLDQALSAEVARGILVDGFGVDDEDLPPSSFEPDRYREGGGLALLPYSSASLGLSVRAAVAAPARFAPSGLGGYFRQIVESDQSRERRGMALAGLAALGSPVLPEIEAMLADPTLTIRETLYLALGAAALGDHASAAAVERLLLARYGEGLGGQVRLRVGASFDDTLEATALLALVAVTIGDPVAPLAEAYVEAYPGREDVYALQQIAYVQRALERTAAKPGRFEYTIAGTRRVVDLAKQGSLWLALTPAQRTTLSARILSGSVRVAVTYDAAVDAAGLARDPSVTLQRVVVPRSPIPTGSIVQVQLRVTFGPQAIPGCYWVTDIAPSGLLPTYDAIPLGVGAYESDAGGPWWIDGSRVSFCAWPGKERSVLLAYWARVVMPGTFRWEPAIVRPDPDSAIGTVVAATTLTIR